MDLTRAAQLTGVAMHEAMGGPATSATLRKTGISLFAWAMALIVVAESRLCRLADPYAIPPGVKSGSASADLEASSSMLEGEMTPQRSTTI